MAAGSRVLTRAGSQTQTAKILGPLTPKGPLVKYSLGISAAQPTSVLPSFVACLSLRLRTPSPIRHLWLPVLIASDENS